MLDNCQAYLTYMKSATNYLKLVCSMDRLIVTHLLIDRRAPLVAVKRDFHGSRFNERDRYQEAALQENVCPYIIQGNLLKHLAYTPK